MIVHWTTEEDEALVKLMNEGGRTFAQISAEIPGRTPDACVSHARALRQRGVKIRDPDRAKPLGTGSGAGRPPNKVRNRLMSFRLAGDVKQAFFELAKATGEKPGALLRHALAYMLDQDELYDVPLKTRELDNTKARIGVCWSVPRQLLKKAAELRKQKHYAVAEQAIIELLRAYGFTIESKT